MQKKVSKRVQGIFLVGAICLFMAVSPGTTYRSLAETAYTENVQNAQDASMEETMSKSWDEETQKKNIELIAQALEIEDLEALTESVEQLCALGCERITAVEKTGEEAGWIYFTVTDTEDKAYYGDTNRKGYFGAVLSQDAYDNMELLAEELEIPLSRDMRYTAQKLEQLYCGSIETLEEISRGQALLFTMVNSDREKFTVRMSLAGALGEVEAADGTILYAPLE